MFVAPGSATTTLFASGDPNIGILQQDLFGRSISYQRGTSQLGSIEVIDADTGAYRSYFTYDSSKNGDRQATQTTLNDKYVFWNYDPEGFYAANRQTGDVRRVGTGLYGCNRFCATDSGIVCTDGAVRFVDQETGAMRKLVPASPFQADGACSASRDRIAFVDYRDTPSSTLDDRSGGDVYVFEWSSEGVTRITGDAPQIDLPKMYPTVDGNTVAWNQAPSTYMKVGAVPEINLYGLTTTLAVKDLATGKTCLYDKSPIRGFLSLIGRRLYGYSVFSGNPYVAELNLDDPTVPWKCQ